MVLANEWIEYFICEAGKRSFLHFSLGFTKSPSYSPHKTHTHTHNHVEFCMSCN